jgi:alkaline phosphatase
MQRQGFWGRYLLLTLLPAAVTLAQPPARNAILMIPDGCGFSLATLSRWYVGHALALDLMLCGAVRTDATNSIITESAAAATAFATGHKTSVGQLGIGPTHAGQPDVVPVMFDSLQSRPLATLLEAARRNGKSTGLVATCAFEHATPAAFAAHVPDRDDFDEIARQMAHQKIDVVFGGGLGWLLPASQGGRRADDADLTRVLAERDCRLIRTGAELAVAGAAPVWGLFADEHLHPAADRIRQAPIEPSLAEMTAKAISLLACDSSGFFLMVEGSQVDWAGHANDPFYAVTEFLAFDSAVRVAQDFAARDGRTLVVACSDHNCGGLTIGSATSPMNYDSTSPGDLFDPLRRMRLTSTGLVRELGVDISPENIRRQVRQWWGVALPDSELSFILRRRQQGLDLENALAEDFSSNHSILGWTSRGHTGEDVPLWASGPGHPTGLLDNTGVARAIADALGLDLDAATRELFADLGRPASDSNLRLDTADIGNPALVCGNVRLPIGTDLLITGSDTTLLDGVTVYSPGNGHVYGPVSIRNRFPQTDPPAGCPIRPDSGDSGDNTGYGR